MQWTPGEYRPGCNQLQGAEEMLNLLDVRMRAFYE